MRTLPVRLAALAIVPLLLLALAPSVAAAEEKIAVIDVLRILEQHPRSKQLQETYRSKLEEIDQIAKANRKIIEELARKVQEAPEGPKRDQLQEQYDKQVFQADYDTKRALFKANRVYLKELEAIYHAILTITRSYAREQGYSLVLQRTPYKPGEMNPQDKNDFVVRVMLRGVVFADDAKDITDAVLARIKG